MVISNALSAVYPIIYSNTKGGKIKHTTVKCVVLLLLLTGLCNSSKCSSSASKLTAITSWEDTFTGTSQSVTYGVVYGQVSHNLYFMYSVNSLQAAVIRKTDTENKELVIKKYSDTPITKSLSIDSHEQNLYFASSGGTGVTITKLFTSDLTIANSWLW